MWKFATDKAKDTLRGIVDIDVVVGARAIETNGNVFAEVGEFPDDVKTRVASIEGEAGGETKKMGQLEIFYTRDALEQAKATAEAKLDENRSRVSSAKASFSDTVSQARNDIQAAADKRLAKARDVIEGTIGGARTQGIQTTTAVFAVMVLIVGISLSIALSRTLLTPIQHLTSAMRRLADGDTNVEVPAEHRQDEMGGMAQAFRVFRDNALEKERLEQQQAEQQRRAEEEKRQAMHELADTFEQSVAQIVRRVSEGSEQVRGNAKQLVERADQTQDEATQVAHNAQQASDNVNSTASAADELSNSINEVTRQINESARKAGEAVTRAEETNETVQHLKQAAQKIGEVATMIQDIAERTNLLALNATIEAARAGEAGKGFAVVADEVKSLANQTQRATEDISGQIENIRNVSDQAVTSIEEITGTVREINEAVTHASSAAEEQNSATSEISRSVDQAAKGTQEVSKRVDDITSAAQDTGQMANTVLSTSDELAQVAKDLNSEVDTFLGKVREG